MIIAQGLACGKKEKLEDVVEVIDAWKPISSLFWLSAFLNWVGFSTNFVCMEVEIWWNIGSSEMDNRGLVKTKTSGTFNYSSILRVYGSSQTKGPKSMKYQIGNQFHGEMCHEH